MKNILLPLLLLLHGCTMYPEYEPRASEVPTSWRIPTHEMSDDIAWWKELGDPILSLLIKEALKNNQNLLAAISRIEEYAARWEIASADLYPQINLSGSGSREKISSSRDPIQEGTASRFNAFDLALNVSYLVDLWGKVRSQSKAAEEGFLSQIENQKAVLLTLVTSVASNYILLRQYDLQHKIAIQTVKSRKESYKLAKVRFELGLTSKIEVDQALSEIEDAQTEEERIKRSIAIQEDLISFLVGKPSFAIPRGCMIDEMKRPPQLPSYLPSEVIAQRPDIVAQEKKLLAANARIGVARARFFPEFTLSGSFGAQSSKLSKFLRGSSLIWDYGGSILQEIFTGGKLTGGLRLAEATKKTLLHEYQSIILQAFKEVNDALIAHSIALNLVEIEKKRVETLRSYLFLSNLRYQEGEIDYLTFLDAERQLFRAELAYIAALGNSFTSLVDIYKAFGGNWVEEADSNR